MEKIAILKHRIFVNPFCCKFVKPWYSSVFECYLGCYIQALTTKHHMYLTKYKLFRILLIKIMRPEALLPSIRWFVHDLMGENFIQNEGFNLDQIYSISQSTVPLIFILSPGSKSLFLFVFDFPICRLNSSVSHQLFNWKKN